MSGTPFGSILVRIYREFLDERNFQKFVKSIAERYTEGTLARIVQSGESESRQAAVLALRFFGSSKSVGNLARALDDSDRSVCELAENSLWAIWRRAGTRDQNQKLAAITMLISDGHLDTALEDANELIREAPRFAEAYNQRAIAYYESKRYKESILDCQRVLKLNPVHFGAAAGKGQCYLALDLPVKALEAFRQALQINPNLSSVRENVQVLERSMEE